MRNYTINETKNYSIFKIHEENREVLKDAKYHSLKKNIESKGYVICPIICNDNMEVIDGQHRLEVMTELELPVPYVVNHLSKGSSDIKDVNNFSKSWNLRDYIIHNRKKELNNYDKLEELVDAYGDEFGVTNVSYFFNDHDSEHATTGQVRNGDFKLTLSEGYTIIGYLNDLNEAGFSKYKASKFSNSLKKIIRRNPKTFDIDRLIHVIDNVKVCHTGADTITSIKDAYNYKIADIKKIY